MASSVVFVGSDHEQEGLVSFPPGRLLLPPPTEFCKVCFGRHVQPALAELPILIQTSTGRSEPKGFWPAFELRMGA